MEEIFHKKTDEMDCQPGGPFVIQMLFKNPVELPEREHMTDVMQRHIGTTECSCCDDNMVGFTALDHVVELEEGKRSVQLFISTCSDFEEDSIDDFQKNQMWDCKDDRDRIFHECKYQVFATDMLATALPRQERANLDMDFLDALVELFPTCKVFYFQNCGKLFLAEDVKNCQFTGLNRFIRFGVNVRFFHISGSEDIVVDTIGMGTLCLPDFQYYFHDMNPNWVVNHGYNMASYILNQETIIGNGDAIMGILQGTITKDVQWQCYHRKSLINPSRDVIDVNMGRYAAGNR